MKVVVLEPEKEPEIVELAGRSDDARLHALQKLVGGYIEAAIVDHKTGLCVYCNEEGLLHDLPFNGYRPTDGHPLVGTLVATEVSDEGEQQTLSAAVQEQAMRVLKQVVASRAASHRQGKTIFK